LLFYNAKKLKTYLKKLGNKFKDYGVHMYLFGSFATNEHHPTSDVDVLIIAPKKYHDPIKEELDQMLIKRGILISALMLTPTQFDKVKDLSFYADILKEGKQLA